VLADHIQEQEDTAVRWDFYFMGRCSQ